MRSLIAVTAATILLVAGCAGDSARPTPSATTSATPTPAAVLPLTGAAAPGGVVPARPALVVKVDNTGNARPQVGLSGADLVVEELVEGGLTRLAVMFHSGLPPAVAPVRSVRTTDIGIVGPTGGILAGSGGARRVLAAIDAAGIDVVTEGEPGVSRDPSRRVPYNVVIDPGTALGPFEGMAAPAVPYLPWTVPDAEASEGIPATTAAVRFSPAHTTRWQWSDGRWRRVDDLAAAGDEFQPVNLLVLRVTTRDAGYLDPAGNPVPETVLDGSGEALLLSGGQAAEGRWSKQGPAAAVQLQDASGAPLTVPTGRTWIELVPEEGSVEIG
ncbi:MAG TPA: DUF3048 domain-containing protein [Jiangellaceae bacterium]|nr:DUF3048 domain-containing protein [Jiangellaceae bacterium]